MLLESLKYIANDLDQFLKRKYDSQESRVVLCTIVDQDNSVPEGNRNKIILTLISLEQETHRQRAVNFIDSQQGLVRTQPPLAFNLDIMFSALFNQYDEALKFLSDAISFFQAKPVFNKENSPGLDPIFELLTLEVIKLNSSDTYNLWASLGTKYVPSIPFKLRLLTYQSNQVEEIVSGMQGMGVEVPKAT